MFDFKQFVRKQADIQPLQHVAFDQLVSDFKAVNIRMVENKEGVKFLHVIAANGDYISTRIGAKVRLVEEGTAALKELIDNYLLYFGVSEEGNNWMTWGPAPSNNEPLVEISIADLMKSMKVGAATAKS